MTPGDLNKLKKEGKTSWDSFAYALMMGHNVYKHIDAVQMANRLLSRSVGMSHWVPDQYIEFQDICVDLFEKDYGGKMSAIDAELNKHDKLMAKLSGTRQLKMTNKFDNLFNFDTQETNTEINSDEDEDDLR